MFHLQHPGTSCACPSTGFGSLGQAPSGCALIHAAVASGTGTARASLGGEQRLGKVQHEEEETENRETQVLPSQTISLTPSHLLPLPRASPDHTLDPERKYFWGCESNPRCCTELQAQGDPQLVQKNPFFWSDALSLLSLLTVV